MITCRRLGTLGRFGNQLFQYAGTRLYAELNGFSYSFPHWRGNELFQNIQSYTAYEYVLSRFLLTRQLSDLQANTPVERILHMAFGYRLPHTVSLKDMYANPRDTINLYGYFQEPESIALFAQHKKRVSEWYTFKNEIEQPLRKITQELGPYIGVHIRMGDWVTLGIAPPIEPFKKIVTEIRGKRPIVVCSESKEVIDIFRPLGITCILNPLPWLNQDIFDFILLRNAATIIGSGSTFSWWAAYLGDRNDYYALSNHSWDRKKDLVMRKHEV